MQVSYVQNITDQTFGMINKDSANSAIASCSLDPRVVARFSRYTDNAASTAPPPATTCMTNIHVKYTTYKKTTAYRTTFTDQERKSNVSILCKMANERCRYYRIKCYIQMMAFNCSYSPSSMKKVLKNGYCSFWKQGLKENYKKKRLH